jgi:hypothetical protein
MGMLGIKSSDLEYPQFQDVYYDSNMIGNKWKQCMCESKGTELIDSENDGMSDRWVKPIFKEDEPPYNINRGGFFLKDADVMQAMTEVLLNSPPPKPISSEILDELLNELDEITDIF